MRLEVLLPLTRKPTLMRMLLVGGGAGTGTRGMYSAGARIMSAWSLYGRPTNRLRSTVLLLTVALLLDAAGVEALAAVYLCVVEHVRRRNEGEEGFGGVSIRAFTVSQHVRRVSHIQLQQHRVQAAGALSRRE